MNLTVLPDGRAGRYAQTVAYADRRDGGLTKTQRPQRVQAVADRVPNATCGSRASMTRPRPRFAVRADQSAAVPAVDADNRQAEYFLHLLAEGCRRIDEQIDRYQKAITVAEASGAVDHGRRLRRAMRLEQQERLTLTGLIDRLHRRFSLPRLG